MTIPGKGPPDAVGPESGGSLAAQSSRVQRLRHPSDASEKVIAFLDRELRASFDFSVSEEYPSVFAGYPGGESLFYAPDGDVASHVAFTVREFLHPSFRFKIGLLGSVATAPLYRGQGMASALLRESFAALRARGCALAVLWSDRPEFYRPMGFFRAGAEVSYRFDPSSIPDIAIADGPVPRAFDPARHATGIWRLYVKQPLRLDRSLEELKSLCRIPRLRVFVTENESTVTSYLAIQKGADFEDYVHEWGGDPILAARSLEAVQKHHFPATPLTVIGPATYAMEPFRRFGGSPSRGALGLVKLVDRRALRATYLEYLRSIGANVRWEDDLFFEGQRFSLVNDSDVLKIVLGAEDVSVGASSVSLPPPLPFFLWGLDSI